MNWPHGFCLPRSVSMLLVPTFYWRELLAVALGVAVLTAIFSFATCDTEVKRGCVCECPRLS